MITTQSTDARVVNELGLIDGCFDETGFSLDLVSTTGLLDLLAAIAMDWSLTMLFFCGPRERERRDAHLTSTSLLLTITLPRQS